MLYGYEGDSTMAKATWDGVIVAESDKYEMVEGNLYFPPESVKSEYLQDSGTDYECPWKGNADYFDIIIGDKVIIGYQDDKIREALKP